MNNKVVKVTTETRSKKNLTPAQIRTRKARNQRKRLRRKEKTVIKTGRITSFNPVYTSEGVTVNKKKVQSSKQFKNNCYLHQLVDPEHAELCSYPDKDSRDSATLRPFIDQTLNFTKEDHGRTPAGTYSVMAFPQYNDCALQLRETSDVSPGFQLVNLVCRSMDPDSFLGSLDGTKNDAGRMSLDGNYKNIVGSVYYDYNRETAVPQIKGDSPLGQYYGIPGWGVGYTSAGYLGNIYLVSAQQFATTHTIEYRLTDYLGTVLKTAATPVAAAANSVSLGNIFQGMAGGDLGFPGVGIQMRVTDSAGLIREWPMLSIEVRGYVGYIDATNGAKSIWYQTINFPDQTAMNNVVTSSRCIAMSAMVSFQGNSLQNGGRSSAIYYGGGVSPGEAQLHNYEGIAEAPNSYKGYLMEGSYCFWKPTSDTVMRFREFNQECAYEDGYLCMAGVINSLETETALRLRIVQIIEVTSRSQILTINKSRVQLNEILQAEAYVSFFPNAMGNPVHLENIRKFLQSVGQTVVDTGRAIYNNWDTIKPFAQLLMTAAGLVF